MTNRNGPRIAVALCAAVVVLMSVGAYWWHTSSSRRGSRFPTSTLPHVDGAAAVEHVSSFYGQYLSAAGDARLQMIAVKGFGDANLAFYAEYYQHGFDPLTCSASIPKSVRASLVKSGTSTAVSVTPEFDGHEGKAFTVTVILDDSMHVDSVDCGQGLSHLAPGVQVQSAD
jgi:hypothetical protein